MPVELRWSRQARDDLIDIYVTIALDRPAAAERVIDRIETRIRLLAEQPRLGVRRPEIRASVRMLVESPYLVLYETTPDRDEGLVTSLEIVRVVDGRRELTGLA